MKQQITLFLTLVLVSACFGGVPAPTAQKSPTPILEETFERPLDIYNPAPGCGYGASPCAGKPPDIIHTGIDYWGNPEKTFPEDKERPIIFSSASGYIKIIHNEIGCKPPPTKGDCDDHGMGNTVIIRHILADSRKEIYTLYAHLEKIDPELEKKYNSVPEGTLCVDKHTILGLMGASGYGQQNWYTNSNPPTPHLHLEFKTKGILSNPSGRGTKYGYVSSKPDDWGYRNPNDYIGKKSALTCNALATSTLTATPAPVPTFTPSVLGATAPPVSFEPPPLDRQDYYSVLQWIKYSLANNDIRAFELLADNNVDYGAIFDYETSAPQVPMGGVKKSKQQFLSDLSSNLKSKPQCDDYVIYQVPRVDGSKSDVLAIWTSTWEPDWEMNWETGDVCHPDCSKLKFPKKDDIVGFFLAKPADEFILNSVWVGDPTFWFSMYRDGGSEVIDCDTVSISPVSSSSTNLASLNQADYFSVLQRIKYAALNNDISVFEDLIVGNSIQLIDGNNTAIEITKSDFLAELSGRLTSKPNCEYFMFDSSNQQAGRLIVRISDWSPGWGVDGNTIVYLLLEMKNNQWALNSIIFGDALPSWASGLESISFETISISVGNTTEDVCKESRPTRLKVGDFAFISFYPPLNQRVRSSYGTTNPILDTISLGTAVKILDGPECADNWVWWKIKVLNSGLIGWTSEGDKDAYWLIPCESRDNCGTR